MIRHTHSKTHRKVEYIYRCVYIYIYIYICMCVCAYYRWEKNHFCFDRTCTDGEKATTKPAGPGFDESELGTRRKEILFLVCPGAILE